MIKSISSFAAAMIAAGILALPPLPPQVRARGPELCAGGDPIGIRPLGIACSQREWPYFEACLRDPKRHVRIVSIDRIPSPDQQAHVAAARGCPCQGCGPP